MKIELWWKYKEKYGFLFYFIKNIVEFFIENYTQINSKFWFYFFKKRKEKKE